MQDTLNKLSASLIQFGLNVLFAIVILIVGKWAARIVSKIAAAGMAKAKLNATLATFFKNIIYYALFIFVFIAALGKVGIETTSFVALIGAAGLAVGLALQGSLANFAGGVMLVVFQPFKVGDQVEIGGAEGIVKEIQIFSTILCTKDQKTVFVPNAKITSDKMVIHRS